MRNQSLFRRVWNRISGANSTNMNTVIKPDWKQSPSMVVGNSILNTGFSLRVDHPVAGRKYVHIADDSILNCRMIFEAESGEIVVGARVFIGNSDLICVNRIEFGNNIFVSWGCTIADHDGHSTNYRERQNDITQLLEDLRRPGKLVEHKNWASVKSAPIRICDNAWIGMHCIITKGVTIGEGAIIAGGSVVVNDIPAWTIAGGNPAKVIKEIPIDQRGK